MEKIIAGRHLNLHDRTKALINDLLTDIEGEYDKLTSARVVVDKSKHGFDVEAILHGKKIEYTAKASDKDIHVAIAAAIEKVDRQLRKFLDKVHDHHKTPISAIERAVVEARLEEEAADAGVLD
jgi:putative sigma-54 modulation protein